MGYDADKSADPSLPAVSRAGAGASAVPSAGGEPAVPPAGRDPAGAQGQSQGQSPEVTQPPDTAATPNGTGVAGAPGGPTPSEAGARRSAGAPRPASERSRRWSRFELPLLIAIAIAIAIVLKSFVVQPFYIPSQSMEQTLHGCPGCTGDRILVFKPVYHVRDPHPGDIVVFRAPQDWDELAGVQLSGNPVVHAVQLFGQLVGVVPPSEKDLVKRVIAVGGQTVRCCDSNGNVEVSDHGAAGPWRSLDEPYIYENSTWHKPTTPGQPSPDDTRSFGPVTVPAGRLWVMGDHRSDSADSRYHCGDASGGKACDPMSSTVGDDDVIGKAVVIAWPPSRWRTLGTPKTFTSLGAPALGVSPVEPAAVALVLTAGLGGWRRRRRRR